MRRNMMKVKIARHTLRTAHNTADDVIIFLVPEAAMKNWVKANLVARKMSERLKTPVVLTAGAGYAGELRTIDRLATVRLSSLAWQDFQIEYDDLPET